MADGDQAQGGEAARLPPTGPTAADKLLRGAVDLHHHGYPEFSLEHPTRLDDAAELRHAREAGLAAIVFKSHFFPTTAACWHLNRLVPGIQAVPSVTLNPVAGGFQPISVEAAARQGARVLYMPTWGAANDVRRGGVSRYLARHLGTLGAWTQERALTVTDERGRLRPEVAECLAVAGEHRMLVATGHISAGESLALTAEALARGATGVMIQHPDNPSVGATREEMRDLAAAGATLEFVALGFLPGVQRLTVPACIEIIREVGAEQVVLSTDCFFDWMPPCAELLRTLLGGFLFHGLPEGDAALLVRGNPRRLLGLTPYVPATPGGA